MFSKFTFSIFAALLFCFLNTPLLCCSLKAQVAADSVEEQVVVDGTQPHPGVANAVAEIREKIKIGPFEAKWKSLEEYKIPQWYRDAKFGIFIHWGAYSVPAFGSEWYPRQMYIDKGRRGDNFFQHHVEKYGAQKDFGYKDFIPQFKAEKFDAAKWAKLFKDTGARYVIPVAEHHDGFPMYDCSFTRWDSTEMGPKRDVIQELSTAVRSEGMKFGLSSHRAFNWMFYVRSEDFDNSDPKYADLYGRPLPFLFNSDAANYEKNFPPQDDQFKDDWLARSCELVDKYKPDVFWFDFGIAPNRDHTYQQNHFAGHLKEFAAYYYNQSSTWDDGIGIINYKWNAFPELAAVYDKERSKEAAIRKPFWQTDTAVSASSWGYTENQKYKTPDRLVDDLVDIVSKNGCLLLNVGPRPDGTIPEEDQAILQAIGGWLKINGESIYNTTHWKIFGEGPTGVSTGHLAEKNDKRFTPEDLRFTWNEGTLYVTGLAWPENGRVSVKTLAEGGEHYPEEIVSVEMLGSDAKIKWNRDTNGLNVELPQSRPSEFAYVLKVRSKADGSNLGASGGGGHELDVISNDVPMRLVKAQSEKKNEKKKDDIVLPDEIEPSQKQWYVHYVKQKNIPKPAEMLLNLDVEPELTEGFSPLFNGTDLEDWVSYGGTAKFDVVDGQIRGTCDPESNSTYLTTKREDFADFVFTCDIKWEVDGNTGVMFRSKTKKSSKAKTDTNETKIVYGPQLEMEEASKGRGWSGGIYGQSCGGYFYPLWLKKHEKVRGAVKEGWNRVTIKAEGNVVKTWVNGVPASHWVDDGSYPSGAIGLQIHKGKQGTVLFKNIMIKEL